MKTRLITKNLSCRILLLDGKFNITNFLKKYGTLSSLLEDLVTRKMTVNSVNADQISFIINLMHGYNEGEFFDIKALVSKFLYNTVLTKANNFFLDIKKIQGKNKELLTKKN